MSTSAPQSVTKQLHSLPQQQQFSTLTGVGPQQPSNRTGCRVQFAFL